ncbi:hypothetical protein EVS81_07105 [Leucobacter triazinivorans]|uniref:Uncharacterized protein n=1 Tax=Leucobacter triazinivorans TaxID=1784719 RepID=A0A4P6KE13_9MICO|nr:hypothetical protein EVS81_07105 [Leucobacter triazinivorans]
MCDAAHELQDHGGAGGRGLGGAGHPTSLPAPDPAPPGPAPPGPAPAPPGPGPAPPGPGSSPPPPALPPAPWGRFPGIGCGYDR